VWVQKGFAVFEEIVVVIVRLERMVPMIIITPVQYGSSMLSQNGKKSAIMLGLSRKRHCNDNYHFGHDICFQCCCVAVVVVILLHR
jgi:hypothetical protein